jgi:AcrR family transcriptional regulator
MGESPGTAGSPLANDDRTRSAILDAAAARYARYGPRKTTMEEVARTAGFSRATVYKYFANKDALYRALLDRDTRDFIDEVKACVEERSTRGDGAREKLRRIVEITQRVYSRSPVLLSAAAGDEEMRVERIAAEAMRSQEAQIIGLLAEVIREGVRAGSIRSIDPEAAAYLMFQLGNVLVIREASGRRDFPFKKILDAMDDLVNHGLVHTRQD